MIRRTLARHARGILFGALAVALAFGGCGGGGGAPAPTAWDYVLSPELIHYGASYGAWSARWWQWAGEMPATGHPLYDPVGTDAWKNQIDPVWFIGGVFGTWAAPFTGSAERTVVLPPGKALFFPIINGGWDNVSCLPPGWTPQPMTELRRLAYEIVSAVEDVYCYLDDVPIIDSPDLSGAVRFRAIAPEFSILYPADSIGERACNDPPGPVFIDPVASDGIWMMLAPLPPGEHTLRFGGTFPSGPFRIDIVYHITVAP